MVFQDPFACLHPMYRVGAQIAEAVLAHDDVGKDEAWARAVELLERVGIPNAKSARPRLSAPVLGRHAPARDDRDGARAQPGDPDLRRADDRARRHRAGADHRADRRREARVRHRRRSSSRTTSASSRRPPNSVMVMYAGRIMEYGPARQIFDQPQHPYAWGLLDSMPTIERRLTALVPIEGSPPSLLAPPSGCPFHPRCRYRFEPCPTERPPLVAAGAGRAPRRVLAAVGREGRERQRSVRSARLGDAA